jgi:hypothetical protein
MSSVRTVRHALSSAPSTHACRTLTASPAKCMRPSAAGCVRLRKTFWNFPGPKNANAPVSAVSALRKESKQKKRNRTHRVRILGPAPGKRINELLAQELDLDIVDVGELSQHELPETLVVPHEGAEAFGILRPAVARDQRRRFPVCGIAKGWVHDCAKRRVGVRLTADDVERASVLVRAGRPPRAAELHADLDGSTVVKSAERIGLHRRKASIGEVERTQDWERNGRDDMGEAPGGVAVALIFLTVCWNEHDVYANGLSLMRRFLDAADALLESDDARLPRVNIPMHSVRDLGHAATAIHQGKYKKPAEKMTNSMQNQLIFFVLSDGLASGSQPKAMASITVSESARSYQPVDLSKVSNQLMTSVESEVSGRPRA